MVRAFPFLFLIALSSLLVSCESSTDPTDSSSNKGNLLISPTEFHGVQFETYSFKAKVEGYPKSDVKFFWDFGDGSFLLDNRQDVTNRFSAADTFYIKVKAVDAFTEAVLDIDSIKAYVTRPDGKVTIAPRNLDTVITDITPYTYRLQAVMHVSSSYEPNNSFVRWYINDSLVSPASHYFTNVLSFPSEGSYEVKAEVFDETGYFVGTDSTAITIRLPTVSMNDISSAHSISAFLVVDKTSNIAQDGFQNPITFGTVLATDQYRIVNVAGNKLDVTDKIDTGATNDKTFRDNLLSCSFSSDLRTMTEFRLTVNDSAFHPPFQHVKSKFSYSIKDIRLASATSSEIIYTAMAPTTAILSIDLLCRTNDGYSTKTGDYTEIGSHVIVLPTKETNYSQIIIVFTR
jgi:hypothetical protein